jgi:cell division septation protein DedD
VTDPTPPRPDSRPHGIRRWTTADDDAAQRRRFRVLAPGLAAVAVLVVAAAIVADAPSAVCAGSDVPSGGIAGTGVPGSVSGQGLLGSYSNHTTIMANLGPCGPGVADPVVLGLLVLFAGALLWVPWLAVPAAPAVLLASLWRDPAVSVASGAWWCVLAVLLWGLAALGAQEYTSRGRPWYENAVNDRPLALLPKDGRGERRYVNRAAALVGAALIVVAVSVTQGIADDPAAPPAAASRSAGDAKSRAGAALPSRQWTTHTPDAELYAYAFTTPPGAVSIIVDASTTTLHQSGSRFRDSTTNLWQLAAALAAAAALLAALQGVAGPSRMALLRRRGRVPARIVLAYVHRPGEAIVYPADDPHGRRPMFRCRIPAGPTTAPDRPREAVLYGELRGGAAAVLAFTDATDTTDAAITRNAPDTRPPSPTPTAADTPPAIAPPPTDSTATLDNADTITPLPPADEPRRPHPAPYQTATGLHPISPSRAPEFRARGLEITSAQMAPRDKPVVWTAAPRHHRWGLLSAVGAAMIACAVAALRPEPLAACVALVAAVLLLDRAAVLLAWTISADRTGIRLRTGWRAATIAWPDLAAVGYRAGTVVARTSAGGRRFLPLGDPELAHAAAVCDAMRACPDLRPTEDDDAPAGYPGVHLAVAITVPALAIWWWTA